MKKMYYKPQVMFESFMLSTNIAGGCESIVGNPSKGTCALIGTGGINMFSGSITDCEYKPEDMGCADDVSLDGFCYHVPVTEKNLFNS